MAKLIETGEKNFVRFENAEQIIDWKIETPLDTKLNKLRKTNPEAFFYWYQVYFHKEKGGGRMKGWHLKQIDHLARCYWKNSA